MFKSRSNFERVADHEGLYVVVCSDETIVDQIAGCLSNHSDGKILSFANSADLAGNLPVFDVNLLVFAGEHSSDELANTLQWSRRHWAKGVKVVVGNPGDFEKEITARRHAAFYLTRPTMESDWAAILDGVAQATQPAGL